MTQHSRMRRQDVRRGDLREIIVERARLNDRAITSRTGRVGPRSYPRERPRTARIGESDDFIDGVARHDMGAVRSVCPGRVARQLDSLGSGRVRNASRDRPSRCGSDVGQCARRAVLTVIQEVNVSSVKCSDYRGRVTHKSKDIVSSGNSISRLIGAGS